MPDPLARVKRAAKAKERASREYTAALVAAVDAGESFADTARAAGISRQAARTIVGRASR